MLLNFFAIAQTSIHNWDFNTGAGTTANNKWPSPVNNTANASNVATGTLTHNFTKTENFAGSAVDASGFTSTAGASFSVLDLANNNNALILSGPTNNYSNIIFTYATQGTASGFNLQTIDYSIDGTNFINLTTTTLTTSYTLKTFDFSSITAANNNANFKIKITVSGATGTTGNNRFDNFRIAGTPIPILNNASVSAGINAAEPSTNGTFNFNLTTPAPVGGVTINYTLGGTAIIGTDYTDPQNGTITIPAGTTTGTVTLNTIDDNIVEATKNIILTITSVSNGFTFSNTSATISLLDNDAAIGTGIIGFTYNFNTCSNFIQQGFTQYSVTGAQIWGCNKAGRTYTVDPSTDSCMQMDGYLAGSVVNEDWLISPSFNLTTTNNPILQFYSKSKFSGNSLQLKVSTNYISGTNPNTASWATINGNFPAVNSGVWYLSDNIDLSAFNNSNVNIAWFYTSTTTAASRWQIDDIKVDVGCTAPTAQPTALILTPTLNSISGNFTAAVTPTDNYLILMSSLALPNVVPTNGTIYAIDDILGNATVVSINNATTFTINNLIPATTYYFKIYAYNNLQNCYQLLNPLQNSIATLPIPVCTPPTIQANNLTATNITGVAMDINYNRGNGDNILVVAHTNTSVDQNPTTGINYVVGTQIGTGNFVIYNGPANTFNYNTLVQNTTYYFALYEYFNTNFCYNLSPLTGNFTTNCITPVNVNNLQAIGANAQATISWANPTVSCYDEVIVVASTTSITGVGSDFTAVANNVYTAVNQVVYTGTGTSVNVTGLTNGVNYFFKIFSRKGANYSNGVSISATPFDASLGYLYLYGNLHSHSSYSDGNKEDLTKKPIDDFRFARDANCMDFLGISEHNHAGAGMNIANFPLGFNDANTANLEVGPSGNTLVTLWGMEWGVISGGGHVLTYGFNNQLIGWESGNYNIFCAKNDYASLFNLINAQPNAFAMLAHPAFTDFGNIVNTYSTNADNAVVGTAIETGPAFSTNITYSNFPAPMAHFEYYKAMLAKGYKLGPSMDGDNHYFTFGRQSANRLVVLATGKNREAVTSAIKEMRFYASNDCNVKLDFKNFGNVMGTSFQHIGLPSITVNVTDTDAGEVTDSIYIFGAKIGDPAPAEPIKKYFNQSSITFDATDVLNVQPDNTTYYYFTVIKQADGNRAISAPIWYTRNDNFLPIQLLNFTANYQTTKTVLLQWITSQEINSKHFEIQKSINTGISFTTIGTINAKGFSSNISNYYFTDLAPFDGLNLYRLKEIDLDGRITYSPIVVINLGNKNNNYYSLYPNIANYSTNIISTSNVKKKVSISLYNESGIIIQKINCYIDKYNAQNIDTHFLKSGIYFVKIEDGIIRTTQKLIIE